MTLNNADDAVRADMARINEAIHEAHRTEPDYWIRQAESAIKWGHPERVDCYLKIARYYRDGEGVDKQN